MAVRIYHNPRCSKSRETLALLQEQGISPEIIDYLKTPPDAATLRELLALLGMGPRELLRSKEEEYRALALDADGLDDDTLIAAMVVHPRLIERPIVVLDERAVLARPPERVLALLGAAAS
ncbi:arsenate reductase (glutaredoxin) [Chitinilyticum litopenaei]|uniref:arsenate reductase (glutaredoxin) n=1 Tax=Chitinilyticum litopenaei TaxID=1121276 RepID=UPI000415A703|nr:arsenate reductase (glutaredoxin) [Chitinilyticum litopenaei]